MEVREPGPTAAASLLAVQRAYRWGPTGMTSPEQAFALPTGTVTFLLTDVESSTRLWSSEDDDAMRRAIGRHYELLAEAVAAHGGIRPQEQGEGDSIVAAFARPSDALRAAVSAQLALASEAWPTVVPLRVRMAVHTGEAQLRDDANYAGQAIIRTARLRSLGHGGQILVSGASRDLAVDQLGDEITLRSLGEHELRDLGRREQVWQVVHPELADEFPPLRVPVTEAHNLPVSLTPFIGRLGEIDTLARLVASERVVTATGSGGAGKTRLAQQVGAVLLDNFTFGVRWTELAPLAPSDVEDAVRAQFGISEGAQVALAEAVRRTLDGATCLLILDNCEHVVDAVTPLVVALTSACPTLHILSTSRVMLDVPGEVAWRVPPLRLPDRNVVTPLESLDQFDAVRLFCDRARRARPNFRLDDSNGAAVAALCHRLDGIPLALELAAARCRVLSPAEILGGLDDALGLLTGGSRALLPRQQTLEASIAWSVDLLTATERRLLSRLSVFVGGCTLDAAEVVGSDDDLAPMAVLDALDRLVDHSLIATEDSPTGTRYTMLETVRQFAGRLLPDERAGAQRRHGDHFAQLVTGFQASATYDELVALSTRLEPDHANLMAAFDDLIGRGDIATACDMIGPCREVFGRHQVYRRMCDTVLAHEGTTGTALEVMARRERAISLLNSGRAGEALADIDRACELARSAVGVSDWLAHRTEVYGLHIRSTLGPSVWDRLEPLARSVIDDPDRRMARWTAMVALGAASAIGRREVTEWRAIADSIGHEHATLVSDRLGVLVELGLRLGDADPVGDAGLDMIADVTAPLAMRSGAVILMSAAALDRGECIGVDLSGFRRTAEIEDNAIAAMALAAAGCGEAIRVDDLATAARLADRTRVGITTRLIHPHWRWIALAGLPIDPPEVPQDDQSRRAAGVRIVQVEVALREGRTTVARALLPGLVRQTLDNGFPRYLAESVDALSRCDAALGRAETSARLAGAVARFEREKGLVAPPCLVRLRESARSSAAAAIGDDEWARLFAEGEGLDLVAAAEYALRSHASPVTERSGWEALTPTERQVTALAADGLTNPQIGKQLLMSPETVKTHLSRSFAKLGVSRRNQLAQALARQAIET
jgi:predicted ATPase/class 3 adenylate cyclase/DNA-binding CsgD family transcriptional regulator